MLSLLSANKMSLAQHNLRSRFVYTCSAAALSKLLPLKLIKLPFAGEDHVGLALLQALCRRSTQQANIGALLSQSLLVTQREQSSVRQA